MIRSIKKGSVLLMSAVVLLSAGCRKERLLPERTAQMETQELTPLTKRGANTFSCKINGVPWVPIGNFSQMGTVKPVNANYTNGKLYVYGVKSIDKSKRKGDEFQTVAITVFSDYGTDVKLTSPHEGLSRSYSKARGFFSDWSPGNCEYETDNNHEGNLHIIHHDSTARIISGTFAFKAYSKSCGKTVNITDGRFDVRY
jgi:hypothetical protein